MSTEPLNKGVHEGKDFIVDNRPAEWVLNYWLTNLNQIKDTIAKGTDYLNLASVGSYALAEAISFNLFGRSARHYYEVILEIPHSHLLYEAFRNGYTHSYKPNALQYDDAYISWAWSSDTSPSGFRPYYPGEYDEETHEEYFPPDTITEYIEFEKGHKQLSITLDRLVARIEADLKERLASVSSDDTIDFIVGKKIRGSSPSDSILFEDRIKNG